MTDAPPPPAPEYPPATFPVVFSDGTLSADWSDGVVKIYFGRSDPDIRAQAGRNIVPTFQLVMPYGAFANSVVFLSHLLEKLKSQELITADAVERAEAAWRDANVRNQ